MVNNMESLKENHQANNGKPVWREFIESVIIIALLALTIRSFIIAPFKIPSSSMVPTLEVGDYLFVTRYNYGFRIPLTDIQFLTSEAKRGDVVVFDYPEDRSKDYIKRIVGVPGDIIEYKNNMLTINGKALALQQKGMHTYLTGGNYTDAGELFAEQLFDVEHAILRRPDLEVRFLQSRGKDVEREGRWIVPEGKYFAMGDNRNNSRDSRYWGFVPQEYLVGKAVVVWWSWKGLSSWSVRWDRLGQWVD